MTDVVVCVDFGSTFTKAALIELETGRIVAAADHRTTIDTDVLDGYDACLVEITEADDRACTADVLACSSAGGGLRIAVIGNEELVTSEAGRRVALSSGGKVVAVSAGPLHDLSLLTAQKPDVLLLVGGTDGGNQEVLLHNATTLANWSGPIVVAGNIDAQAQVANRLAQTSYVMADNVLPQIGVLKPESARAAIREMFLKHVIGGKHLSSRGGFIEMVRGATPDVVLTGVELLAEVAGDVVVVDIGGATTDVHSVVELDPEDQGLSREVVATTRVTRTVEGDLGMRWSAGSTVEAAQRADLETAARHRQEQTGFLPSTAAEFEEDEAIATAAAGLALRRHAGRSQVVVGPDGRVVERTGKDLREVRLLVGSGGVLRHGRPNVADRVLKPSVGEHFDGGWQLPRAPEVTIDSNYILAAAGLLSETYPHAARQLVRGLLPAGNSLCG